MTDGPAKYAPLPWPLARLVQTLGLGLVGVALLFVSWAGSSQAARFESGQRWAALAIAAGLLSSGACTGWLLHGLRNVRARQQQVAARTALIIAELRRQHLVGSELAASKAGPTTGLVSLPGATLYHVSTCLLVRGKDVTATTAVDGRQAGLDACGVCRP